PLVNMTPQVHITPAIKAEAKELSFYYAGMGQALKSISLGLADRHATALIGPSGCGKTTFLRCLNRMHDLYPGNRYAGAVVVQSLKDAALWPEVKDRLHSLAYNLSGGQQQRLCIARSLATGPEMMLFDEPTSALDPTATARIEELVTELKQRVTIVIVTHNMQQAARVSDYTAFMYE